MDTILISGANGLLAQEYMRQGLALKRDMRIIAVSNNCEMLRERYRDISHFSCFGWDELDSTPVAEVSLVLHCAFSRTENGNELLKSLKLTERLLNKTGPFHIPFVSISSRSVYGQNPNTPWTEESILSPEGMYALAKCAQEMLVQQAAEQYEFPHTNLRLAGLMGIGMDARLISKLVFQAIKTESMSIIGGQQKFSLLDIRDAASALWAFTRVPADQWEPVYNLGHSAVYTLDEIADAIKRVAFQDFHQHINVSKQEKDISLIDGMDCSRFYQTTGWSPHCQLEDTIRILFESMKGES